MRKVLAIILALVLIVTIAIPVYACDGSIAERWRNWWGRFWFYDYTPDETTAETTVEPTEKPEPTTEPEVIVLGTPIISESHYNHSPAIGKPYLLVRWDEVEYAESYEVEIEKADGTITTHITTAALFMLRCDCPTVYVEETSTFTSATVRARAVVGDVTGEWSESAKIGCNSLHVFERAESHD